MEPFTISHAILPIQGIPWLCHTNGPDVIPLAQAPGKPDANFTFTPEAAALAVMDMDRKRAGLFKILKEEPWFERVLPFASLPKDCKGHAVSVLGESLLVGGQSKTGEALWIRTPGRGEGWRVIPIPERLRSKRKAVDGLVVDGNRVIAVDDIEYPKWVIVYQADGFGELRKSEIVSLPSHTTYEQIRMVAQGSRGIGLLSWGINHGSQARIISLIDSVRFMEMAVWSAHSPGFIAPRVPKALTPIDLALLEAVDLGFAGDQMLVACGKKGLLLADFRGWTPPPLPPGVDQDFDPNTLASWTRYAPQPLWNTFKQIVPGPKLEVREVLSLSCVDRIMIPTPPDPAGAFIIGSGPEGVPTYAWVNTV